MTKRLCRPRTSNGTPEYDWAERGMWGKKKEPKSVFLSVFTCVFVCVFMRERYRDDTWTYKWVNTSQGGTVITNTPNSIRHAMTQAHLHRAESSWSEAGRRTVRGACQPANSHHQRNYIHKHCTLSYRVPFDPPLTPIWAFQNTNICCRYFHFSIRVRSLQQISGRCSVSHSSTKTKIRYRRGMLMINR